MGLLSLRVVRKWWYLAAVPLIGTVLALGVVAARVPSSYQTTGTLLLLQPETGAEYGSTGSGNAFTGFGFSLQVTADAMVTLFDDQRMVERLRPEGASGAFTVTRQPRTPMLVVDATGSSPVEAVGTARAVMRAISQELARRQNRTGAPPSTWIRIDALTLPAGAAELAGSRLRAGAALGGLGLGLVFGLPLLAETVARAGTEAAARRNPFRRPPPPRVPPSRLPPPRLPVVEAGVLIRDRLRRHR